jgi:hypothetical protein
MWQADVCVKIIVLMEVHYENIVLLFVKTVDCTDEVWSDRDMSISADFETRSHADAAPNAYRQALLRICSKLSSTYPATKVCFSHSGKTRAGPERKKKLTVAYLQLFLLSQDSQPQGNNQRHT